MNILDDCNEFGITEVQGSRSRSVIVSAPREIDHFAPPPDRAGRGSVMMEELPLSPAIGTRRSVFTGGWAFSYRVEDQPIEPVLGHAISV